MADHLIGMLSWTVGSGGIFSIRDIIHIIRSYCVALVLQSLSLDSRGTMRVMPDKPLHGRKIDGRGQHKVVPITDFRKQAFLEWLCTPVRERDPKTMADLAEQLQLTRRTLTNWKTDDKEFIEEWEKRYLRTIGNPERKAKIMDTLLATATDADDPKHVQAAKTYFEIEGSVKPAKMQVEVRKEASELTDAELAQLISLKAEAELRGRETA